MKILLWLSNVYASPTHLAASIYRQNPPSQQFMCRNKGQTLKAGTLQ